jgi:hypothetical protein
MSVNSNWRGNEVGSGDLYRGHSDGAPDSPIAASTDDSDGYYGTGNTGFGQRRTMMLSNGAIIWDFTGNVWEWTSGQVSGGQPGKSGESSYAWKDWKDATVKGYAQTPGSPLWSPFPAFGTPAAASWTFASQDIGQVYSNSGDTSLRGFIRGGDWNDPNGWGIFSLAMSRAPTDKNADNGFRIAK